MSYNPVDIDTYQAVLKRAEQAERALAEFKHEYNAMMGRYEAQAAEQTQQIHEDERALAEAKECSQNDFRIRKTTEEELLMKEIRS